LLYSDIKEQIMFYNLKTQIGITVKQLRAKFSTAAAAGPATMSTVAGKFQIAAGASSVVITNSMCTAASIVLVTPTQVDAGLRSVTSVVPANGSFTVAVAGAVTANQQYAYFIIQGVV
jgi:hypothetical protein